MDVWSLEFSWEEKWLLCGAGSDGDPPNTAGNQLLAQVIQISYRNILLS